MDGHSLASLYVSWLAYLYAKKIYSKTSQKICKWLATLQTGFNYLHTNHNIIRLQAVSQWDLACIGLVFLEYTRKPAGKVAGHGTVEANNKLLFGIMNAVYLYLNSCVWIGIKKGHGMVTGSLISATSLVEPQKTENRVYQSVPVSNLGKTIESLAQDVIVSPSYSASTRLGTTYM